MNPIIPITCTVVHFDGVGLQDLYATLDCSRRGDGASTRFESFADSQGNIMRWLRCAEPPTYFEPVNARDYERICLTFPAALYFGHQRCPWVTVQVNIEPAEFEDNSVKLQFGLGQLHLLHHHHPFAPPKQHWPTRDAIGRACRSGAVAV
ncbi:hypothetical protein F5B18DRAFT_636891 [Nemania serpens]|nr:hypothetical protein F5B18DRAFT_636891 [Nemania serpens]